MDISFTPVLPGSLPETEEYAGLQASQQQRPPERAGADVTTPATRGQALQNAHGSFQCALRQLQRAHEDEVTELKVELERLRGRLMNQELSMQADQSSQAFEQVGCFHQASRHAHQDSWASPLPKDRERPPARQKTLTFEDHLDNEAEGVPPVLEHRGGNTVESEVSLSAVFAIKDDAEDGPSRRGSETSEPIRGQITDERPQLPFESIRRCSTMFELVVVGGGGKWLHNWINLLNHLFQYAMQNTSQLHEVWVMSDAYLRKVAGTNDNVDLWNMACERKRTMRRGGLTRARNFSQALSVGSAPVGRISTASIAVSDLFFDKEYVLTELQFRLTLIRQGGWSSFFENYMVVAPHARRRLIWVSIGMCLMFYDVIVLPLQAFDYAEDDGMMSFMKWFQAVFWTCDMIFTFFTAIYVDVELVTKPNIIARQYLRSWLFFDLGVLIPVWVEQLLSKGSNLGAIKIIRMMRFLRLVRLAKFEMLLGESLKAINSPSLVLLFKLFQLVIGLVIFIHINACVWYLVGKQQDGWTTQVADAGVSYKYFTSVHWALTQFQGTSEIYPGRFAGERAYAASLVLISMIIAAAFLSNFTNIVMQLQALTVDRDRQIHDLCLYMRANKIPRQLSMRVRTFLLWKSQKEKHRACDALKCLPSQLVMELEFEIYQPVIQHHDFFNEFIVVYPRLSRRVLHESIKPTYISPSDLVFSAQESCFSVYFVMSGILDYAVIIRRQQEALTLGRERVGVGCCLSEPTLWMHWQHRGTLVAETYSNILVLSSECWRKMVVTHPPALLSCNLYARRLIAGMARQYWKCTDILNPAMVIVEEKSFLDCLISVTLGKRVSIEDDEDD